MPRSKSGQSKHDKEVRVTANAYKKKGYEVEADVIGYPKPASIGGFVPDVRARKGGQETVIEVETHESVDSVRDIQQQGAFQRWARRSPTHHFKRKVTE